MKKNFLESLKSRKFIITIIAAAVSLAKFYLPCFPDSALYTIVGCLMGYVLIQGIVDITAQFANGSAKKPAAQADSPAETDARYIKLVSRLNEVSAELQEWLNKSKA
ncbi:MAG: hypothetical protein XD78_1769 [Desulfotomaculum sp. 46_296]|nr:MAG: hypothetical protein XD78_1769 [Desulfotomaculum sp. 46_296]KUK84779.1 MAG: hypothetical protein XE00_0554 [Desulfofundulus kuznetsovii]